MLEMLDERLAPAIFTVNTTADNTLVDSFTTLREAITAANSAAGADTINFNIPGDPDAVQTISPTSALPTITGPTTIDGYTQGNAQPNTLAVGNDAVLLIELNGASAGAGNGLQITGGSSTVRGLVIRQFGGAGVRIVSSNNVVGGNNVLNNGSHGVFIQSSSNNTIGGTTEADRNVVSGNAANGIFIAAGSASNRVQNNYVGTNAGGTAALANGFSGLTIQNSSNTLVADNVLSGNTGDGITILNPLATGTVVLRNRIGTNASGTTAIPNMINGVIALNAASNVIENNQISGNSQNGVYFFGTSASGNVAAGNLIGTNADGTDDIPNGHGVVIAAGASGNTIGGSTVGSRNVISGNVFTGVLVTGDTHDNQIRGNRIGTNVSGTAAIGNLADGVVLAERSFNNTIENNLISGNRTGIDIQTNSFGNTVKGNWVGIDANGASAIPNTISGVLIRSSSHDNTIGGPTEADRNVISGNAANGIQVGSGATNNRVQGNYVGTDKDGNPGLGNSLSGIALIGGSSVTTVTGNRLMSNGNIGINIIDSFSNVIGGSTPSERNLSSGNLAGISINTGSSGNVVKGNWLGVDASGTVAMPNAFDGVTIATGAHDNTIGGPNEADRNVIAGNGGLGVQITINSFGNVVRGNYIGADVDGAWLGNGTTGHSEVGIFNNCDNNTIRDNLILATTQSGINVAPADSTGNTFFGNRIQSNGSLPIDLQVYSNAGQVNLNDLGDGDTGANNYQNFPFIAGVNMLGPDTFISGSLYSTPSTSFRLEFFAADALSPSGHRQAQYVLGTLDVTTDGSGLATFVFEYAGSLPGPIVTATATNFATGDTSELFNPSKPTDIALSNATIEENAGANALVGNLTTTDPDLGDSHFYTLVSGTGSTDNALFTIVGNQLRAENSLNYADGATRSVRIRTTDLHGLWFEKSFTITVLNRVDLSGRVFDDRDNDGAYEPGDGDLGIGGVVVQLFDEVSDALIATRTTAADGSFLFDVKLGAGTYRVAAGQPAGFLDGRETAGNLGGTVDNSQDSNVIAGIEVGEPGSTPDGSDYLFAWIRPSQALGLVWSDFNNDGNVNFGEAAIAGVMIELTGTDDRGNAVSRTATTDVNGIYGFIDLRPSNAAGYAIREVQPAGYLDGLDVLGTVNGVTIGNNSVNDTFSGVVLPRPASLAENYNFSERPPSDGGVTPGQTATIGYWQNNNGQNLINALNGGSTSTQLGNWLAASFPNMYGASAGANNLAGKTNAQVATFYKMLFARTAATAAGGGPAKMDAQVLATAFAVYVTNQSLAGTTASSYGFQVSESGVGSRTFNVGSNGAAFGVANNASVSVMELLMAVNARSRNGLLYDLDHDGDATDSLETSFRTMANNVFSAINEAGDI